MSARINSRLAKLEKRHGGQSGAGRRLTIGDLCGVPGLTLCELLQASGQLPAPPPPTGRPRNAFDADAYLASLETEHGE